MTVSHCYAGGATGPAATRYKFKKIIDGLTSGAEQVTAASGQVASASEQASSLEETSSSLEEMSSMTKQNADNANQANVVAELNTIVTGSALSSVARGPQTGGRGQSSEVRGQKSEIRDQRGATQGFGSPVRTPGVRFCQSQSPPRDGDPAGRQGPEGVLSRTAGTAPFAGSRAQAREPVCLHT